MATILARSIAADIAIDTNFTPSDKTAIVVPLIGWIPFTSRYIRIEDKDGRYLFIQYCRKNEDTIFKLFEIYRPEITGVIGPGFVTRPPHEYNICQLFVQFESKNEDAYRANILSFITDDCSDVIYAGYINSLFNIPDHLKVLTNDNMETRIDLRGTGIVINPFTMNNFTYHPVPPR